MTAWTGPEVIKLRALYGVASWNDLCAALPRHERNAIQSYAQSLGLRRTARSEGDRYAATRHPWVKILRDRRLALGLSQSALAEKLNIDRSTIFHLEGRRSKALPQALMLARWAKALGFKLDLVPMTDNLSTTQYQRTMITPNENTNANPS